MLCKRIGLLIDENEQLQSFDFFHTIVRFFFVLLIIYLSYRDKIIKHIKVVIVAAQTMK